MISDTEFYILGVGATCLLLAQVLLKSPQPAVQRARLFTVVCAALSIVFGLAGWLLARPWAAEALLRGAIVAAVVLAGVGAVWVMRARLRPRGFQNRVNVVNATARKYEGYRRVAK